MLDRLKDYRIAMAVVGPGLEQADVPFEVPNETGAVVFPTDTVDSIPFTVRFSRFTRFECESFPSAASLIQAGMPSASERSFHTPV